MLILPTEEAVFRLEKMSRMKRLRSQWQKYKVAGVLSASLTDGNQYLQGADALEFIHLAPPAANALTDRLRGE